MAGCRSPWSAYSLERILARDPPAHMRGGDIPRRPFGLDALCYKAKVQALPVYGVVGAMHSGDDCHQRGLQKFGQCDKW